jgi:adenine-specific DNA-methyltransferase
VADSQTAIRAMRGIQLPLLATTTPLAVIVADPKGVVYTRRWVVELLLDLAGYSSDANLVDAVAVEPAAGDGAFLGPMIERLVASCRRHKRTLLDCRDSIVAYELDTVSAERARLLASDTLMNRGVDRSTAEALSLAWVRTGDYLFETDYAEANFVIGNPPYVRLEEIPEETARSYRARYPTMRGRADLYVAFFEAALRQLHAGGVCAFICADRWMRNQYGAELRELVTSAYGVEFVIEMHDADAFHDEVDAYPAITVIRRKEQGPAVVASAGPEVAKALPSKLSANLLATARRKSPEPCELRSALIETWFKGSDPWPCHSPKQLELLRRLEEQFLSLETHAKVGIGVATGNDGIFITKDATLVEQSRLLKLALAKDTLSGSLQWSGHYLIDPWDCEGLVDLNKFPRLRAYFEQHAAALKKRHTALKSTQSWYKTIDRVAHSLTPKPKLYIPDIKDSLEPVLDRGKTYPHHNLYFVQSHVWDLEILGGLLMSAAGQFFVESYGVRMRGGYWRFQAQYLRRIRVPDPKTLSESESKELAESFRHRDKERATDAALNVYRISRGEMEIALGH